MTATGSTASLVSHAVENRSRRWVKPAVAAFLLLAAATGVIAGWTGSVLFSDYSRQLPSVLHRLSLSPKASITIVDRHGRALLYQDINGARHIPIGEVPGWFEELVLEEEDRRFYHHSGVDFRGIARAAVTNVTAGRIVEGGSTITQQLVKLLLDTPERTVYSKILESLLAAGLERRATKEAILRAYMNHVYLGQSTYGFETAAMWYFGRPLSQINVAQGRTLVLALPNPARLVHRLGHEPPEDLPEHHPFRDPPDRNLAPYPASMALQELRDRLGDQYGRGELIVETSIELHVQAAAQRALQDYVRSIRVKNIYRPEPLVINGAVVVLHSDDGTPAAIVGGDEYSQADQFNRAIATRRPIGSTVKPFIYAAAMERFGYTADTIVQDRPTEIQDQLRDEYGPENHYLGHRGDVTLEEALARSINTVALQLAVRLGVEETQTAIERFQLSPSSMPRTFGLALGAAEFTPMELAVAYTTFVRDGEMREGQLVRRVYDRRGRTMLGPLPAAERQVLSPDLSRRLREMMKAVFRYGGTAHRSDGHYRFPIAGKTGSHGANSWFVGFSPEYLTTVWIGVDRTNFWWPRGLRYNAHSTFHRVMHEIHPHDYVGAEDAEWF